MLQGEHSAILSTFIKLLFVIKVFVLSILGWLLKTGFTVLDEELAWYPEHRVYSTIGYISDIINRQLISTSSGLYQVQYKQPDSK